MMNSPDTTQPGVAGRTPGAGKPRSAEQHNDRTHDSTVDTDGKNHEAARLAGRSPIGPDEITTSNATLENSVPEASDGFAGFDSRVGGNRLLLALEPGYIAVDKGMVEPEHAYDANAPHRTPHAAGPQLDDGRAHLALNHLRPTRLLELQRIR
jgi:hypothetical protein